MHNILDQRELKISVLTSARSNSVKNVKMSWGDLSARLSNTHHTTETESDYHNLSRNEQAKVKDIGGFVAGHFHNNRRKKINLKSRSCITLDVDFADETFPEVIKKRFSNFAFLYHTTHSHTFQNVKYRVIIPLRSEVTVEQYQAVARKLAADLEMDWIDPTCFRVSQLMYWASTPADGEYEFHKNDQTFIDPKTVLNTYKDWRDISQWPLHPREEELRISSDKAEDPLLKKGIIGAFCKAFDIHEAIAKFLPDVYIPCADGRYTYHESTTASGAVTYDDKFLFSFHDTDPCSSKLVNAFDLVRIHRFGSLDKNTKDTAVTALPSYKALCEEVREDEDVKLLLLEEQLGQFDDLTVGDDDLIDEDHDIGDDDIESTLASDPKWYKQLDINNRNQIEASLLNIRLIFENDPKLRGTVKYNEFAADVVQIRNLPELPLNRRSHHSYRVSEKLWEDLHIVKCRFYLESRYSLTTSDKQVDDTVMLIADNLSFHPVIEYLESQEWDGKKRAERLFIDYLGAEDNVFIREASRKTLAAAVARVYEPGCKFDYMPILEGEQGKRKSTFIKILAKGWFTDNLGDIRSKEAVENIRGKWIIESAELQAVNKSDIDSQKAFFSREVDRIRESYGRRSRDFPRQCIVMGTVNPSGTGYLKDHTGNRRYWPIECRIKSIPIEKLQKNIDQIWAEALQIYRDGEPLYLSEDAWRIAESEQEQRRPDNELVGIIRAWADRPISVDHYNLPLEGRLANVHDASGETMSRDLICIATIWQECLGKDLAQLTTGKRKEISRALKELVEWDTSDTRRRKVGSDLGVQRCYQRVL